MILSRYTRTIPHDDGTIVYNVLNNKKAVCFSPNDSSNLARLISGEDIPAENISIGLKHFCVDAHIDEKKIALGLQQSFLWDKSSLGLIVMPTMECNMGCIYCYENKSDSQVMDNAFMEDTLSAIIQYHKDNPLQHLSIEWYGGEPLIKYAEIVSFTERLNTFCEKERIEVTYGMTTNAYLLTKERAEKLLSIGITAFQITLDGMEETHNRLRPHISAKDSWATIVNNLQHMKQLDYMFNVKVRINYDLDVLDNIEEFHNFIKNNLDKRFRVFHHAICKWGGVRDDELSVVDPNVVEFIDVDLVKNAIDIGLEPEMSFYFASFGGRVCYANRPYFYIITWDRKLRKCTFTDSTYDENNVVGKLLHGGRFDIDSKKALNFVMPDYPKMVQKGCFDCFVLPICQGSSCGLRALERNEPICVAEKANIDDVILQEYNYRKMVSRVRNVDIAK